MTHPIRQLILKRLRQIERERQIKILYACESGSRAWGFPSRNSDYDVRFIYAHPHDWYLTIDADRKRDTIERPLEQDIDMAGWDLRKALGLLYKSNPPLLEWLRSPIVYLERPPARKLRTLASQYFSPSACAWHYVNMARTNYREYLRGLVVHLKKYFYVLRPLLAVQWIEKKREPVPMEFIKLVRNQLKDGALRDRIEELIRMKRSGIELDRGPRIPILNHFIETELARLEKPSFPSPLSRPPVERLNKFFRACL